MYQLRESKLSDFPIVASWIRSEAECRIWCGSRVSYPPDLVRLPQMLEFETCESWTGVSSAGILAFGQLVPKVKGRFHLARLITIPECRGSGLGRLMADHLLKRALARKASAVSLNVFSENVAALSLYQSLGFSAAKRPGDERESQSIYMEYAH